MNETLLAKETKLLKFLQRYHKPALGFSGGVDSSLLLAACKKAGVNVQAITACTPVLPAFEQEDAKRIAEEWNVKQTIIPLNPLELPEFCANSSQRCYYCKRKIFTAIKNQAAKLGCDVLLDGANADDTGDYRPGMKAAEELRVVSPLLACGLTKAEVRALARRYGVSVADKPAYACLASRIAYGEPITLEKLRMVEQAEDNLRTMQLHDIRVRCHGAIARIEITQEQLPLATGQLRQAIIDAVKDAGFTYVTLDLEGFRSGSMNADL